MRQQDGSDRGLGSPFIDGEFFAAGNEEWTSRPRLLETESPYADGLNEVAEEGVVSPEFEEQVFTLPSPPGQGGRRTGQANIQGFITALRRPAGMRRRSRGWSGRARERGRKPV